jgi:hypothetical protein
MICTRAMQTFCRLPALFPPPPPCITVKIRKCRGGDSGVCMCVIRWENSGAVIHIAQRTGHDLFISSTVRRAKPIMLSRYAQWARSSSLAARSTNDSLARTVHRGWDASWGAIDLKWEKHVTWRLTASSPLGLQPDGVSILVAAEKSSAAQAYLCVIVGNTRPCIARLESAERSLR